jgi:hypothetical protein
MPMNNFNIGDRVMYNDKLYKVIHIYDNGNLKLQSIRGKSKSIYYNMPPDLVQKEEKI